MTHGGVIARHKMPDQERQSDRGQQAADRDGAKTCFLSGIVLQIEIDADETAVAALAVIDGRMRT